MQRLFFIFISLFLISLEAGELGTKKRTIRDPIGRLFSENFAKFDFEKYSSSSRSELYRSIQNNLVIYHDNIGMRKILQKLSHRAAIERDHIFVSDQLFELARTRRLFRDPLPIIQWMNSVNSPSFFSPVIKEKVVCWNCFTSIHSLNNSSFWAEPYFFSSPEITRESDLNSVGVSLGYGGNIGEKLTLGLGGGYTYSRSGGKHYFGTVKVDRASLGPYIAYTTCPGALSLSIQGAWNKAEVVSEVILIDTVGASRKTDFDRTSWDISARFDANCRFNPFWDRFYLVPKIQADIVYVIEEEMAKSGEITIDERHLVFYRALANLGLKKEFCDPEKMVFGIFLAGGFLRMGVIENADIKVSYSQELIGGGESVSKTFSPKIHGNNLINASLELYWISRRGVACRLKGDANFVGRYRSYGGSLRLDWDW